MCVHACACGKREKEVREGKRKIEVEQTWRDLKRNGLGKDKIIIQKQGNQLRLKKPNTRI